MIVFLHAQLSGYFLSCIKSLSNNTEEEIHIFKHPKSEEAPFVQCRIENVTFHNREEYSVQQLIDEVKRLNPNILFCCGWYDKGYLKVCRSIKKRMPVIVLVDNQWRNTLRQYIGCIASRLFNYLGCFSHIWVAGEPQKIFALKLGFKENQIMTGYYSADAYLYKKLFLESRNKTIPKRFVFVGRYAKEKGLSKLWDAFIRLREDGYADGWELWCIGQGPLFDERVKHPQIKHFGFVQPYEMNKYIGEGGVFILPSVFEPWGVVVHEFAIAGFPLLCSDVVGAATKFVEPGVNGYIFNTKNRKSIYNSLKKMTGKDDDELKKMSIKSHEFGMTYTPEQWASTVLGFKLLK